MDKLVREIFEGRNTLLLGFGREGQGSYSLIRRVLPDQKLTLADADEGVADNPLLKGDENIILQLGAGYLDNIRSFDVVMKSPGITLRDVSFGMHAPLITSQTDLFLRMYAGQVIGVTGTKGKSTTSSLLYHILKVAGMDALLVGNIGSAAFHYLDQVKPGTMIVFELSSHQLEYIERAPHIAILLNLFQEHLDAYSSYKAYQAAKMNIARFQAKGDFLIYNQDDPLIAEHVTSLDRVQSLFPFSCDEELAEGCSGSADEILINRGPGHRMLLEGMHNKYLNGEHNLRNIMAAVSAAFLLGVRREDILDGTETFKGLAHRMEYAGMSGDITFYNDSIATIPEACMAAVKSIPGVDTLVAGGFDRGIDYAALGQFLAHSAIRNFILTGEAGRRIGAEIEKAGGETKNLFYINRFDDFIQPAMKHTRPGAVCLLSPAAASYDEFRNFEERGQRFTELIRQSQPEK